MASLAARLRTSAASCSASRRIFSARKPKLSCARGVALARPGAQFLLGGPGVLLGGLAGRLGGGQPVPQLAELGVDLVAVVAAPDDVERVRWMTGRRRGSGRLSGRGADRHGA